MFLNGERTNCPRIIYGAKLDVRFPLRKKPIFTLVRTERKIILTQYYHVVSDCLLTELSGAVGKIRISLCLDPRIGINACLLGV